MTPKRRFNRQVLENLQTLAAGCLACKPLGCCCDEMQASKVALANSCTQLLYIFSIAYRDTGAGDACSFRRQNALKVHDSVCLIYKYSAEFHAIMCLAHLSYKFLVLRSTVNRSAISCSDR